MIFFFLYQVLIQAIMPYVADNTLYVFGYILE